MRFVAALFVAWVATGHLLCGAVEVPFPTNVLCTKEVLKEAEKNKMLVAVPGKAGEKGHLQGQLVDSKGNMIEVWCLQANNDHGGPDLGYLYTPKGGKSVWVGACSLVDGQNHFWLSYDKLVGAKVNGVPTVIVEEFKGFRWHNFQADDGKNNKKVDYEYKYTVAGDKLAISRTEGTWVNSAVFPFPRIYQSTVKETEKNGPTKAPEQFKDLKLNGTQITLGDIDNTKAIQGLAAVYDAVSPQGLLQYSLLAQALSGSGVPNDPFTGLVTTVDPGDVFSIAGAGIHDPVVSGLAAQEGWVLAGLDENMVSFRYDGLTQLVLQPGSAIDGFRFASEAPLGDVTWGVASQSEFGGYFSHTTGAVPEPSSVVLLTVAVVTLIALRLRPSRSRRAS
ncbi:MAG: hypothetical protein U0836_15970 [Pirellulales bacterium]